MDQARNIQIEGASGAFDKEFRVMEDNLDEIRKIIEGAGVSSLDVEDLQNMLKMIRCAKKLLLLLFKCSLTLKTDKKNRDVHWAMSQ